MIIHRPIVVDWETYYGPGCSIKANDKKDWVGGNYHYCTHPEFYPYLATFYDLETHEKGAIADAREFPKFVDSLRGRTIVGYNPGFDSAVCWSVDNTFQPFNTVDLGDMSQYLQVPRTLAGSVKALLGKSVSKEVRNSMEGKHWRELSDDHKAAVIEYGMGDVELPAQVYFKYLHTWPDLERWLSNHTREQNWAGVHIDGDFLEDQMEKVHRIRTQAAAGIPWLSEDDGGKPLSPKALAKWCRSVSIDPPSSMAEDSEECVAWENKYGEQYPVVAAMRNFRKSNTYVKKLALIHRLMRPDGTIPLAAKYAAAPHTLRWSATSFNYQSLPRPDLPGGEYSFADLRGCLVPKPGHVFIPADLANIEARCLPWLAGDTDLLRVIASKVDIYEAFARRAFNYSDPMPLKKKDPALREIAKVCVLQLGYQSGAKKFRWYIENNLKPELLDRVRLPWGTVMETNEQLAQRLVTLYRTVNHKIKALWESLHQELHAAMTLGKPLEVQAPNGRICRYINLQQRVREDDPSRVDIVGSKCIGAPQQKLYGGLLTENCTQATARDVMAEAIYNINVAGISDRMHIHDEIVAEVPEDQAKDACEEIVRLMSRTPEWLPGCPISAEAHIMRRYAK